MVDFLSQSSSDNPSSTAVTKSSDCYDNGKFFNAESDWDDIFNISPLIRLTLHSLYGCLVVPLPLLAYQTDAPIHPVFLVIGVMVGWILLSAVLSERVKVNKTGLYVSYASWVPALWRKGWSLCWSDVVALKPRSTGQGGIVYYFLINNGDAHLLPMRMAGFARFIRYVQQSTTIDTTDIKPLSQPWMYLLLLMCTCILWLIDGWAVLQIAESLG